MFPWNELLFIGKWFLIILVYLLLFVVLFAVRREMGRHRRRPGIGLSAAPGRLRVLSSGEERSFQRNEMLALPNEVLFGSNRDQIGENGILLRDRFVSARHARLRWDGAQWWVEDLGSTNGTFVAERHLEPHQEVVVSLGATLQIGDIIFQLLE